MHVIGYGSRSLTSSEKRYYLRAGKLEFLDLKWAICEQFRNFLFYSQGFTVYTDNPPPQWLNSPTSGLTSNTGLEKRMVTPMPSPECHGPSTVLWTNVQELLLKKR